MICGILFYHPYTLRIARVIWVMCRYFILFICIDSILLLFFLTLQEEILYREALLSFLCRNSDQTISIENIYIYKYAACIYDVWVYEARTCLSLFSAHTIYMIYIHKHWYTYHILYFFVLLSLFQLNVFIIQKG